MLSIPCKPIHYSIDLLCISSLHLLPARKASKLPTCIQSSKVRCILGSHFDLFLPYIRPKTCYLQKIKVSEFAFILKVSRIMQNFGKPPKRVYFKISKHFFIFQWSNVQYQSALSSFPLNLLSSFADENGPAAMQHGNKSLNHSSNLFIVIVFLCVIAVII